MLLLSSLGSTPAGEGIGSVFVTMLGALGAMALIYGVLELMGYVRRKKGGEEQQEENKPSEPPEEKSFSRTLSEEIKKRNDKD